MTHTEMCITWQL